MGQSDSVQQASFDWILREASSPASVRFGWEGTRWPAASGGQSPLWVGPPCAAAWGMGLHHPLHPGVSSL